MRKQTIAAVFCAAGLPVAANAQVYELCNGLTSATQEVVDFDRIGAGPTSVAALNAFYGTSFADIFIETRTGTGGYNFQTTEGSALCGDPVTGDLQVLAPTGNATGDFANPDAYVIEIGRDVHQFGCAIGDWSGPMNIELRDGGRNGTVVGNLNFDYIGDPSADFLASVDPFDTVIISAIPTGNTGANYVVPEIHIGDEMDPGGPPPTPVRPECGLQTLDPFASNNQGNSGGGLYFDITVGASDVDVIALDMNLLEGSPGGCGVGPIPVLVDVYLTDAGGTFAGNEGNPAAWNFTETGEGDAVGTDNMSFIELNNPITLSANTRYGVALVPIGSAHRYTNGTGPNQSFSNNEMRLDLGSATNVPFTTPVFNPRVANVVVYYDGPCGGCYADCDGNQVLDVFDFLCFQDAFVQGDPYADCDGNTVLDVFDFLCFQDAFVVGCP
jgi:hypothetical protein